MLLEPMFSIVRSEIITIMCAVKTNVQYSSIMSEIITIINSAQRTQIANRVQSKVLRTTIV